MTAGATRVVGMSIVCSHKIRLVGAVAEIGDVVVTSPSQANHECKWDDKGL